MNTKINGCRRSDKGFTLIELMVTVSVIAILSAIVYPSYTKSVRKSRRTEAKTVLLDLAGREERRFSTLNSYSTKPSELQYNVSPQTDQSPFDLKSGLYTITITLPTATTFSITATAIGGQATDTECATLTVDSTGAQSFTGGGNCW